MEVAGVVQLAPLQHVTPTPVHEAEVGGQWLERSSAFCYGFTQTLLTMHPFSKAVSQTVYVLSRHEMSLLDMK